MAQPRDQGQASSRTGSGDGPIKLSLVPTLGGAGTQRPRPGRRDGAAFDFVAAVDRHQTPLLRYVGQMLGSDGEAQDVVQETFLRLHVQVRDHGQGSITSLTCWLSRVAHNLAIDALRRRQRDKSQRDELARRQGDAPAQPPPDVETREATGMALAELHGLPDDYRQVILLRLMQGLKLREISEVTGMSVGNVDYRINQGLQMLARKLKERGAM